MLFIKCSYCHVKFDRKLYAVVYDIDCNVTRFNKHKCTLSSYAEVAQAYQTFFL